MQIIINVVDIKIIQWTVSVEKQNVTVDYCLMKDDGTSYERRTAVFWANRPAQEPDWYELPAEYVATLTQLTIDARAALMGLIT